MWPRIYYALGFGENLRQLEFLYKLINSVMTQREYKPSGENDFVDHIMSWKQNQQIESDSIRNMKTDESEKVSLVADDNLLLAQCYVFFASPKFDPEPEVFCPERFLGEDRRKIKTYVYLPFGEGPRVCIGRFG